MRISMILAAICLVLAACHPEPEPVVMPVGADAGDLCSAACARGRQLHCAFAEPTPDGATCEAFCAADKADPTTRLTSRYLGCLASLKACSGETRCAR